MVGLIQIFGRAAWHCALADSRSLSKYWGFLRWNTAIFVFLNAFTFVFNVVGAMVKAIGKDQPGILHAGTTLIKTGLFLQLFVWVLFLIVIARFKVVSSQWQYGWGEELRFCNPAVFFSTVVGGVAALLVCLERVLGMSK